MKVAIKGCLSIIASCVFAVWGLFLNDVFTMWLWRVQGYDWHRMNPYIPINPMFLGLVMGFVMPLVIVYKSTKLTLCGAVFLMLTVGFFLLDL